MFIDERDNAFAYMNEENSFDIDNKYDLDTNYVDNNYTNIELTENTVNQNEYNNFDGVNNFIFNYRPVSSLTNAETGFLRGNMFNDLYNGFYKRIKKISVTNERERALLKIQELTFASIDLGLYLDVHPNDTEVVKKFKYYNNELDRLTKNYEKIYGPLMRKCDKDGSTYDWIKNPWPWEKGGNK